MIIDKKIRIERNCPMCDNSQMNIVVSLPPRAFCDVNFAYRKDAHSLLGITNNNILFPIVKCNNCGFVYSKYLLQPKLLDIVYEKIINPDKCFAYSTSLPVIKRNLKIWYSLLSNFPLHSFEEENIRVLDYGAGWGTFLEVAKSPQVKVFGYETSAKRLAYMKKRDITSLRNLQEIKDNGPYHIICCNQVLEHVPNPIDTLKLINKVMHKEGVGYLSVPNYKDKILQKQILAFRKEKCIPKELNPWEHLNYFTPSSFRKAISMCDFDILPQPLFVPFFEMRKSFKHMFLDIILHEVRCLKLPFQKYLGKKDVGTKVIVRKRRLKERL